ncbi:MAG: uracil-DNA glycosylase [Steroidobacteraceae bacterium]
MKSFLGIVKSATGEHVFNPWLHHDPTTDLARTATQHRLARLSAHLSTNARFVLIGEAAGYQGCKVSGIPFTSERLILESRIPRISTDAKRLTSRARPWSEPSATTVWNTLHSLGIASETILWNAFPWHPHKPGVLHSNRTPTPTERMAGVAVLKQLLDLFPQAQVFAVGRNAEWSLAHLGRDAAPLRHPSMGGARKFAQQLSAACGARES